MLFSLLFGDSSKRQQITLIALEWKIDLLLKHLGLEQPSDFSERVRHLAADPSRKINAIKALREETGMGLKEAKDAIESGYLGPNLEEKIDLILKHFNIPSPVFEEWQRMALDPAQKIAAIKAYRDATGAGLKDAKDAVEKWVRENGVL